MQPFNAHGRGNRSTLLRWERLALSTWEAAGTRARVEWFGEGQGYTATDPTSGKLLLVDDARRPNHGQVRVFGRPEDAKAAIRRLVLARNAEANRDPPMVASG